MPRESDSSGESPFARETRREAGDPAVAHSEPRPAAPDRPRLSHRPFPGDEGQSFIDKHSSVSGKYQAAQDLLVEGKAEGEIECDGRLTVAEGAVIKARVTAAGISVSGTLDGEITCRGLLEVQPSGRVQGTLTTERLVVQEGAYCDGTIHMQAREPGESADSEAPAGEGDSPTSIFKSQVRKVE